MVLGREEDENDSFDTWNCSSVTDVSGPCFLLLGGNLRLNRSSISWIQGGNSVARTRNGAMSE